MEDREIVELYLARDERAIRDTAQIYITMQDLEDTRVDETMDLFDSYAIHTPFACTGHCDLAGYDPDTRTATFLITIQQWNKQEITGDKLTFETGEDRVRIEITKWAVSSNEGKGANKETSDSEESLGN